MPQTQGWNFRAKAKPLRRFCHQLEHRVQRCAAVKNSGKDNDWAMASTVAAQFCLPRTKIVLIPIR